MQKVIYIAGYGRSGSTILDITLGQHEDVFGAGEMATICRHVWPNDEFCACGQRATSCDFWAPILKDWESEIGSMAAHAMFQRKFEPGFSPLRRKGNSKFDQFADQNQALYDRIARRSGRSVVLDSSKLPGRGLALSEMEGIDLRVIHLVRDARAVAYSLTKPMEVDPRKGLQKKLSRRPPFRTALRWRYVNAWANALVKKLGPERAVRVQYEKFLADPQETLARISRATDVDFSGVTDKILQGQALIPEHQIAGSRIRMSKSMTLRADMKWKQKMPQRDQDIVMRVAGGQLKQYGYLGRE